MVDVMANDELEEKSPPDEKPQPLADILALQGAGKHLWKDEDPDEYVRRLREGWD